MSLTGAGASEKANCRLGQPDGLPAPPENGLMLPAVPLRLAVLKVRHIWRPAPEPVPMYLPSKFGWISCVAQSKTGLFAVGAAGV